MNPPKVLIVDDNADNRYLLETILSSNGYGTMSAVNGEEALHLVTKERPHLIITDVLMPVMDGFALCRQIKGDESLKGIPFIFYTATYTEAQDAEFGLDLGADRYLIKPQDPIMILQVVREVLAGAETRSMPIEPVSVLGEEMMFLRHHNEVLFRKLEKKMADLMESNAALQHEIEVRLKAENALRVSESRLRALLDCSPVGIIWSDRRGGIQYVNRKFVEMFAYTVADLSTLEDFFQSAHFNGPELAALFPWIAALQAAGDDGRGSPPFEGRVAGKDGRYRDVSISGACIGGLCLLVFTDISEQVETRQQLMKAKEAAEAANLAKSRFIANMSHELRTPLTGILGSIQMALQGPINEEQRNLLSIAGNSGRRIVRMIGDIMELTRIESGVLPMEEKEFVLADSVAAITEIFLPEARCKGIDLVCTVGSDLPSHVVGDKMRLQQVLSNLVGNAVKFTDQGRVEVTVRSGVASTDGRQEIEFTVFDTGIGIPADKKEKIFDFFTQADDSHTRRFGGAGLGLTVSRELVTLMGGKIGFESEEGVGSRFFVLIPFAMSRTRA